MFKALDIRSLYETIREMYWEKSTTIADMNNPEFIDTLNNLLSNNVKQGLKAALRC